MYTELNLLLQSVIECAKQAGEAILTIYNNENFAIITKANQTPLTTADIAAHHIIQKSLQVLTPDLPILSEESNEILSWEKRKLWRQYWLVDPLDGTKEFINRNGEFTVNIALIDNHEPILGVVYVPTKQLLYYAVKDLGAWCQRVYEPAFQLFTKKHPVNEPWQIVASRSHSGPEIQALLNQFNNYQLISMGSSLKFCVVAEGQAHIYPRLGPTSEWDTAAAHCIVEQAGGIILDIQQRPLQYNISDSLLNPHFIVASSQEDMEQCFAHLKQNNHK